MNLSIFVEQYLGKRSFGRPRKRHDNIKLDLMEIVFEDVVWMKLAKDHVLWSALVLTVLYFRSLRRRVC
jgi:predicted small integral membrane protein